MEQGSGHMAKGFSPHEYRLVQILLLLPLALSNAEQYQRFARQHLSALQRRLVLKHLYGSTS